MLLLRAGPRAPRRHRPRSPKHLRRRHRGASLRRWRRRRRAVGWKERLRPLAPVPQQVEGDGPRTAALQRTVRRGLLGGAPRRRGHGQGASGAALKPGERAAEHRRRVNAPKRARASPLDHPLGRGAAAAPAPPALLAAGLACSGRSAVGEARQRDLSSPMPRNEGRSRGEVGGWRGDSSGGSAARRLGVLQAAAGATGGGAWTAQWRAIALASAAGTAGVCRRAARGASGRRWK